MERIRSDPFRRNTLSSISGHATISVFKDLLIPITNTLSPKNRYGVRSKVIISHHQTRIFLEKLVESLRIFGTKKKKRFYQDPTFGYKLRICEIYFLFENVLVLPIGKNLEISF